MFQTGRNIKLLGLIAILIMTYPVFTVANAQDFLSTDEEGIETVWKPAEAIEGSIPWHVFLGVPYEEQLMNDIPIAVPKFTPSIMALVGQRIKVNGYMVPLEPSDKQGHFLLMAYTHSCPFHMTGGPNGYIEVYADFPVTVTFAPILIEGVLTLEKDFTRGVFFKLTASQQVAKKKK
ncbi:DUF3299 domain-containing protein [Temperatibacter marinus]|uniref:DUF3299 domain-containing protein n=1 Tax=Temperatibacter marinus TaxID=1456591 RepID=A0AA52EDS6_9PROT|nr:DUF3299 domain-containing protein [Temperatibacter marinus]WND01813.1 DUF3299 domain-containing protein [Temperatibacter marinus]